MPMCFVPGCRSGYDKSKGKHFFTPPKDKLLFCKWEKAIPRKGRCLTSNSYVCDSHFSEELLIKVDKFVVNGKNVEIARQRWKLMPHAVPLSIRSDTCFTMAGTFTNDEYTDMVLLYGEALENASQARRLYAQRFPERRLPSLSVFKRTVMRLKIDGSYEVQQVRQRPVCDNEATVQQVSEYFQENPTHSQRRAASDLGIKRNSIKTIIKEQSAGSHETKPDRKRHPIDLEKLVDYCRRIVESEPSIKLKSDFCCKGVVDSEKGDSGLVKVECDGGKIVNSEPDNSQCDNVKFDYGKKAPQFVNVECNSSREVMGSKLENPYFVKVEPLD